MKVREVECWRSRYGGWDCAFTFTVTTAKQFTDEQRTVYGHGLWRLLAKWRAFRKAKLETRLSQAKPGEREAKGWAP